MPVAEQHRNYSTGWGRNNLHDTDYLYCLNPAYSHVFEFGKVDIVIVDECHLIPEDADTRYGKFFKDMKMANPDVAIFGHCLPLRIALTLGYFMKAMVHYFEVALAS